MKIINLILFGLIILAALAGNQSKGSNIESRDAAFAGVAQKQSNAGTLKLIAKYAGANPAARSVNQGQGARDKGRGKINLSLPIPNPPSPTPVELIIREIAAKYGIKEKHLLAIAEVETHCGKDIRDGDDGISIGVFQIQIEMHGLTRAHAKDVRFASEWTARRLLKNGYRKNPYRAIKMHNGWGKAADRYVEKVKIAERIFYHEGHEGHE